MVSLIGVHGSLLGAHITNALEEKLERYGTNGNDNGGANSQYNDAIEQVEAVGISLRVLGDVLPAQTSHNVVVQVRTTELHEDEM